MQLRNKWINWSIAGLCILALSGLILRSKIVFSLPFINYNHLLEAHSHFTFGGWVTLALMTLMLYELLPEDHCNKRLYQWQLAGITMSSWGMFISFIVTGYSIYSIFFLAIFTAITYVFCFFFIRDLLKENKWLPVRLLAMSALSCLAISSAGTIIIAYLYFTHQFDAIIYRDALFTYLHFQYNGFFSLAIFALLLNTVGQQFNRAASTAINWFAISLCCSIIPSLFLSYLWQNPNQVFRIIAYGGSILLVILFFTFIRLVQTLYENYKIENTLTRFLIGISLGSFMLKTILQCFTIFPVIGNAIFGNRPIIMGFLHLVFLGLVSLFILACYTKLELLNIENPFTKIALYFFSMAVVFNELFLISQGLVTLYFTGGVLFPWLLWIAAIGLFTGTVLIAIARIKTIKYTIIK